MSFGDLNQAAELPQNHMEESEWLDKKPVMCTPSMENDQRHPVIMNNANQKQNLPSENSHQRAPKPAHQKATSKPDPLGHTSQVKWLAKCKFSRDKIQIIGHVINHEDLYGHYLKRPRKSPKSKHQPILMRPEHCLDSSTTITDSY